MDGGYARPKLRVALADIEKWTTLIVKRSDAAEGFEFIPRRWVVEHTFAWLNLLPKVGQGSGKIHRKLNSVDICRAHQNRKALTSCIRF